MKFLAGMVLGFLLGLALIPAFLTPDPPALHLSEAPVVLRDETPAKRQCRPYRSVDSTDGRQIPRSRVERHCWEIEPQKSKLYTEYGEETQ